MSTPTKTNKRSSLTKYEAIGSTGDATSAESLVVTTEYESPNGLDLNNADPDHESSNVDVAPREVVEYAELGSTGTDEDESAPVLLDAIVGSYPELEDVAEVVIGADDRVRVTNTTVYPWRAICALLITAADNRRFIGTGWLVSPRTVITAGHCVYMHDAGGWARSIKVIPGCNDGSEPYGSYTGTTMRSVTGWTSSKNRDHDYGAIILPSSSRPGLQTGTFGLAVRNDSFLMNSALNLSGYPGDKGGRQQWFMAQRPKRVSDRVITYDIDSMGGQSGSPVWVLENGQRYGVGVHTNGSSSGNSATRINTAVFNNMVNWKNLGL